MMVMFQEQCVCTCNGYHETSSLLPSLELSHFLYSSWPLLEAYVRPRDPAECRLTSTSLMLCLTVVIADTASRKS